MLVLNGISQQATRAVVGNIGEYDHRGIRPALDHPLGHKRHRPVRDQGLLFRRRSIRGRDLKRRIQPLGEFRAGGQYPDPDTAASSEHSDPGVAQYQRSGNRDRRRQILLPRVRIGGVDG